MFTYKSSKDKIRREDTTYVSLIEKLIGVLLVLYWTSFGYLWVFLKDFSRALCLLSTSYSATIRNLLYLFINKYKDERKNVICYL